MKTHSRPRAILLDASGTLIDFDSRLPKLLQSLEIATCFDAVVCSGAGESPGVSEPFGG